MKSIHELKEIVNSYASKIGAPSKYLPTYEEPRGDGHPCIKLDYLVYQIVYVERGKELDRKTSFNLDDLLYDVFSDVTALMAMDYEVENRVSNKDPRILLFKKQIEFLGKLSEDFKTKGKKEIKDIEKRFPY